eukprot:TRINITY_DN12883_c0_g1_i1.p1 TRINITY_DN12883_c0_g1~~TRINITY_DN12883_c0_g1_i1.p1  ORF type:complete len:192 (-),score=17.72 TRINITY_DN12883_c0_g1_i1:252-827(-)
MRNPRRRKRIPKKAHTESGDKGSGSRDDYKANRDRGILVERRKIDPRYDNLFYHTSAFLNLYHGSHGKLDYLVKSLRFPKLTKQTDDDPRAKIPSTNSMMIQKEIERVINATVNEDQLSSDTAIRSISKSTPASASDKNYQTINVAVGYFGCTFRTIANKQEYEAIISIYDEKKGVIVGDYRTTQADQLPE